MGVAREITEHWMDWVRMQTCQTPPGHFWESLKEAQADRHGKTPSKHNQNDRNQLFDPDGTPEICLNMIETRNKNGHLTQLQGCNKADWCFQSLHTESYSCCFPCFPTLTVYYFSDVWLTHQSRNRNDDSNNPRFMGSTIHFASFCLVSERWIPRNMWCFLIFTHKIAQFAAG